MTDAHERIIGARRSRGLTLIELLVALAIGSFLILGAVTVFLQGQATFRVNESVARLQENARFVLDAIEPDIRMGQYFGLTTRPGKISNRELQTEPHAGLGPSTCANNWAIDLRNAVEASNNTYPWTCDAFGDGAEPGSDTLTIRRARGGDPVAPQANRMYIQSWRVQPGGIFVGETPPINDPESQIRELVVNGYYVSQGSSQSTPGSPVPSLRRQTLGSGPAVRDEEVLPGVEDMQIQLGVDTDPADDPDRGSVNRFVNPDDPILDPASGSYLADAEILAVRVWLRMRARRPENGYENTNDYDYADEDFTANDQFRRMVVSKTIYLRNTRPAS